MDFRLQCAQQDKPQVDFSICYIFEALYKLAPQVQASLYDVTANQHALVEEVERRHLDLILAVFDRSRQAIEQAYGYCRYLETASDPMIKSWLKEKTNLVQVTLPENAQAERVGLCRIPKECQCDICPIPRSICSFRKVDDAKLKPHHITSHPLSKFVQGMIEKGLLKLPKRWTPLKYRQRELEKLSYRGLMANKGQSFSN